MKTVVFVENISEVKTLKKTRKKIISLNKEVEYWLDEKGVPYTSIADYPAKRLYFKETTDWLNRISLSEVDGKEIYKHFKYGSVPIWWLLNYFLFYDNLATRSITGAIDKTIKFLSVIEKESPSRIDVLTKNKETFVILKAIAGPRNIAISRKGDIQDRGEITSKGIIYTVYLKRTRSIANRLWSGLLYLFYPKPKKGGILLFSTKKQDIYNPITGSLEKGSRFKPIRAYLRSKSRYISTLENYEIGLNKTYKHIRGGDIILDYYINIGSIPKAKRSARNLERR
mgnify:FL=1